MPAEGTLPPERRRTARTAAGRRQAVAALSGGVIMAAACGGAPEPHVLLSQPSPDMSRLALVRLMPCGSRWCESLFVGTAADTATLVEILPAGEQRCQEIKWSRDGTRVAFLIDGRQLRLFDAASQAPAGLVDLVPGDGARADRVARGITFSDNGAAITFDDCPRERSGCRPGMIALR